MGKASRQSRVFSQGATKWHNRRHMIGFAHSSVFEYVRGAWQCDGFLCRLLMLLHVCMCCQATWVDLLMLFESWHHLENVSHMRKRTTTTQKFVLVPLLSHSQVSHGLSHLQYTITNSANNWA
jgi:hypothetical protein